MRPSDPRLLTIASLLAAGCAAPTTLPDGGALTASAHLLEALQSHELGTVERLLAADATLVTDTTTVQGPAAIRSALEGLPTGTHAIEAHHLVGRLTLPDGRLLFSLGDGGLVQTLALFPSRSNGVRTQALHDYQDAWNRPDATARQALLTSAWDPAGHYLDPGNDVTGPTRLDQTIALFQQTVPGATISATPAVIALQGGWFEADWVLEAPGSQLPGFDVGQLSSGGQVALIAGFFTPR